ncbi:hypothetical protein [Pseudonocardia sp. N23]|uniref:hypothetical protein n=1 Tax=Pseudonocardia sp. N23 TaxID=1987376 RepID=UPI000C02867A|nr:hypothetical protein [Pseudonocardia sp. N23]GAY12071.1 hypothetical protein TOK_0461 [Pseudonocardia sp. N23]
MAIVTHPRPIPTPPRGIRQVEYVGRHRKPEPDPVVRESLLRRAIRVMAIVENPKETA